MFVSPNELTDTLVRVAYKKLKANIYYDKSLGPLRDKLVIYEREIESKIRQIAEKLNGNDKEWQTYGKEIIDSIDYFAVPKKVKSHDEENNNSISVISNYEAANPEIEKYQYYIDMDVTGHVLGVLWLLTIGKFIDDGIYEHSYGNRLNKNLYTNNKEVTLSPTLFIPYFSQYTQWRNRAIKLAEERIEDNQDVIITSLDFQSYFYSVDLDKEQFDAIYLQYEIKMQGKEWIKRIHEFVWDVLEQYTGLLVKNKALLEKEKPGLPERRVEEKSHILPIGFLPSNILSNWVLNKFDEEIVNTWNPMYYGRYCDDILIVDKVEKNSLLYQSKHEKQKKMEEENKKIDELFEKLFFSNKIFTKENEDYIVKEDILNHKKSKIIIQKKKTKIYYFRSDGSKAVLTKFKEELRKNASEFRILPELDDILDFDKCSQFINIDREDTVNKFGSIKGINVDRFELSKFLGKHSVIESILNESRNTNYGQELIKIFDYSTLVANYTLWERILEILIISNNYQSFRLVIEKIYESIKMLEEEKDQDSLKRYLFSAVCRSSALCWGTEIQELLKDIQKSLNEVLYKNDDIVTMRRYYVYARMINKSVIPVLVDAINQNIFEKENDYRTINLSKYQNIEPHLLEELCNYELLYPYWIKPQEILFTRLCQKVANGKIISDGLNNVEAADFYMKFNYLSDSNEKTTEGVKIKKLYASHEKTTERGKIKSLSDEDISGGINKLAIYIKNGEKEHLRIGIGNAYIEENDFEDALKEKPNQTVKRYRQLAHILDEALREKCDLLVLPELYMPLSWLPIVIKKCANEQMGLITGLDYIIGGKEEKKCVYNITAVILPYESDRQKHAFVSFHHKVHYAPAEDTLIQNYGYTSIQGNDYQLYSWHGIWFPVYCCFELASIKDRALFSSMCDLVVCVEWNRDRPYYNNITGALSRDLYCYVIEANTAQYGDSGVIQPQSSEVSNIIKVKGGDNCTILTCNLNIQSLREAQIKVSGDKKEYKPTPPYSGDERCFIKARFQKKLWEFLPPKGS